jgi:hypothetical protein
METQGLLFIPDISGFTRFVTETEIDHSRHIIEELLGAVIDANRIGLEVSEIEGDAVLFFRFGASPELKDLYGQVEGMFRAFHECLCAYEIGRFCQCRACVSATNLTLKIVSHYGEFTSYNVKSFKKLLGRDVIVAHQLLKNDVDQREYWLVTDDLLQGAPPADLPPWIEWSHGVKRTEGRDVAFEYAPLTRLRETVSPAPPPDLDLPRKVRMFSASREYAAHIIPMAHAVGDFTYRGRWQEGVHRVEDVSHHLPRIGMRCRRVTDRGPVTFYASGYSFRPDRIEFAETDEDKTTTVRFTLERLDTDRTRLTVDHYVRQGVLRELLFRLARKGPMEASLNRSLLALDSVVKDIDIPTEY